MRAAGSTRIASVSRPSGEPAVVRPAHAVQFYEQDAFLIEEVARFVGGGLGAGDPAVVIATAPHRAALDRRLAAHGLDVAAARLAGRYVPLDAAETLAKFLVDGVPDAARFADVVGSVLRRAARGRPTTIRAFGEMVHLLWDAGKREAAIELETLWNELGRTHAFTLLCAYPIAAFGDEAAGADLLRICGAHTHVVPAESYSTAATADARLRVVAELQQKARVLETEIAQRRRMEETLRQRNEAERSARSEAEAANRAKDEFLAMLGHELRNPLSAVRNAVVTARLDPSRRERALDIAGRGTEQLARLVDDLLDVARITHGRIALRRQRLRFTRVVERAVDATRPLLEERAHVVTVSLAGCADVMVDADATRLEQVITNLIANAAKYTEPGGHVRVTAEHLGDEVALRVHDDGIGIGPDMLPRVFDLFAQAERGLARVQGGLGIGLTIVKRLVEMHGGRVEARSDGLGAGAEFVVWLPALTTAPEQGDADGIESDHDACARVLLVEDNVDAADSLGALLEVLGHRVRVAYDGLNALEMARANPPDVMLVDIGLPGIDGYEVARRVRDDAKLASIVLVALTGYGREEDREHALAVGFDHHLVKPVNASALQSLVARFPATATLN